MVKIIHQLVTCLEESQVRVWATHISGKLKVLADSLSEFEDGWQICKPMIDLWATRYNRNEPVLLPNPISHRNVEGISYQAGGEICYLYISPCRGSEQGLN